MLTDDDAGAPLWHTARASEDRAVPLQRWCPDWEPGCRGPVRRLAWWIDRPSASAPGISLRTGLEVEAGAPSAHVRG